MKRRNGRSSRGGRGGGTGGHGGRGEAGSLEVSLRSHSTQTSTLKAT